MSACEHRTVTFVLKCGTATVITLHAVVLRVVDRHVLICGFFLLGEFHLAFEGLADQSHNGGKL
jgi:hypothetical protein